MKCCYQGGPCLAYLLELSKIDIEANLEGQGVMIRENDLENNLLPLPRIPLNRGEKERQQEVPMYPPNGTCTGVESSVLS